MEEEVQRLKQKYLDEAGDKDAEENPMRACMRIMFEAANERDPTKRVELAHQLSELLVRPNGLINLFLAVIDFDTSSQKTTTHNQRFLAVANIIARLPKLSLPYIDYCDNLRNQLRLILIHQETKYSSLASLIIKALLESPHAANCRPQVRKVLLEPFVKLLTQKVVGSGTLRPHQSVLAIHNLIQNRLSAKLFADSFPYQFYAFVSLSNTPSPSKSYLKTNLARILIDLKPGPACCLLEQTLFFNETKCNIYEAHTGEDQIELKISDTSLPAPDFEAVKQVCLEILENCDSELLVLEFFFHFQAKMWTCSERDINVRCAALIEPLLEEKPANKLYLLTSIISNPQRALELISRTLVNDLDFLKQYEHEEDKLINEIQELVSPSLNNCLDILEVLFSTIGKHASVRSLQYKISNTLREIRTLLIRDGLKRDERLEGKFNSLIDKLDQEPDQFQVPKASNVACRDYEEAMRDLNDPLVPVRVHALVRLKNLILTADPYTSSRIAQLYPMAECSLADSEPYVFLASINLVAEMGVRKTADLLPKLVDLYANQEADVQQRLNVGEVLVRIARRLNETTPFYAPRIIGTFFASTQNSDELIRMSSLSNIGELCRNLRASLGKYIVDVIHCVKRVLDTDTIQVKCAAIELLRSALMGLKGWSVESIQEDLKSIYDLLKDTRKKTIDAKLCLLVDLALDEIDRLARELLAGDLASGDRLTKNIRVLSLD